MAVPGILHGEFMQPELFLKGIEFSGFRIPNCYPNKALWPRYIIADVAERYVRKLYTALICDAVDEHGEDTLAEDGRCRSAFQPIAKIRAQFFDFWLRDVDDVRLTGVQCRVVLMIGFGQVESRQRFQSGDDCAVENS